MAVAVQETGSCHPVHRLLDFYVNYFVARVEECSPPTWCQVYGVEALSAVAYFVPRAMQVACWTHTEAMAVLVICRLAVEWIDSEPLGSVASLHSDRVLSMAVSPTEQT